MDRIKDSILVMAWPETPVRKVGMWYDKITSLMGFCKDGVYKAGHAAAIVIRHHDATMHYFDFGRYHTPRKYGRVRSAHTDHDLKITDRIEILPDGEILNLNSLLRKFAVRESFHGKGPFYVSHLKGIDADKAITFANKLQAKGKIHYGPFEARGTNCSRFIASVVKAGNPGLFTKLRISAPFSLTPTPKSNVLACTNGAYYRVENERIEKIFPGTFHSLKSYSWPTPGEAGFIKLKTLKLSI